MTQTDTDLAGILTPEELEAFSRARENYRPYLATGRRDRIARFFSMEEFETLVNQTSIWTPERMEVILDTKKVAPQHLFAQLPVHNGVRYRVQNAELQKLLERGASIVLNDIDTLKPGLKRLRSLIAAHTGARVESNLYYSQHGHQAFSLHFDVHDVFAFQITGEKRWQVYQQICRHPINHLAFLAIDPASHDKRKGPVSMDVTLQQGDFLYLPAGFYHQAMCTGKSSAHLSFSAVEMIALDVVTAAFEKAVRTEFFRTPIGRTLNNGNQPMADYLKLLAENLEALMLDDAFVKSIEDRFSTFPYPTDDVTFRKEGKA